MLTLTLDILTRLLQELGYWIEVIGRSIVALLALVNVVAFLPTKSNQSNFGF